MRRASLALLLAALVVAACTPPEKTEADGSSSCAEGCTGSGADAGKEQDGGYQGDAGLDAGTRNEFCGKGCNPDPAGARDTCSGMSGASSASEAPVAGQPGGPSAPTPPPASPAPPTEVIACQIVRGTDGAPVATCLKTGTVTEGELCQKSSDCGSGMACVIHPDEKALNAGRCRSYCCGGGSCESGTYCGLLPLFEPTKPFPDPLPIPVCAPATNCKLLTPGACGAGQACTLVNEKTTTCGTPGTGVEGDKCPCAEGYYCTPKNACRKLCHIGADQSDCGSGACVQGGSALPTGFGVCAGGDAGI